MIQSISRLQQINIEINRILEENDINVETLIIKKYYKDEELEKMSYSQLKDYHELLIDDFKYLKDTFEKEVFFKNLNKMTGIV